jgi:hypothetical protein
MKRFVVKFLLRHIEPLKRLSRKFAFHFLFADIGMTTSAHVWELEQLRYQRGKKWRPRIDAFFFWLAGQTDHCRKAYESDMALINHGPEDSHVDVH